MEECMICKGRGTDRHHLIMGRNRSLADADKLTTKLCRTCHSKLHQSGQLETKSKQIGQLIFEMRQMILLNKSEEDARRAFMARYGKNYI